MTILAAHGPQFAGPIIGWVIRALTVVVLVVEIVAFVNCLVQRAEAFSVVGSIPKGGWLALTGPGALASLAAVLVGVAAGPGDPRAVGASLGAGALWRLLADRPGRFERLVFFLPAVLDRPRPAAGRARLRERISDESYSAL